MIVYYIKNLCKFAHNKDIKYEDKSHQRGFDEKGISQTWLSKQMKRVITLLILMFATERSQTLKLCFIYQKY